MAWESAQKVAKNEQGQYIALIGDTWVPVDQAAKNESGDFQVLRQDGESSSTRTPARIGAIEPPNWIERQLAKLPTLPAGVESELRRTLQGAASGPVMGAVQLGASMFGNKELEQKIAQTAKEGNFIGSLLQPEAWLTGGAMGAAPTLSRRALTGAAAAAPYGALAATTKEGDQLEQRGEAALVSGMFGAGVPLVGAALGKVGSGIGNLVDTIGAAVGKKSSVEALAADAAQNLAKNDAAFIRQAIQQRTQYVHGSPVTVAESIAEKTLGKPYQAGGATVRMQKTLSGAAGAEDILPTTMRAQEAAVQSFREGVEKSLAPVRNSLLRRANKQGVDTSGVLQNIQTTIATPGDREAELIKAVMPKLYDKIDGLKQSSAGVVDARDLYSIRKDLSKNIKAWAKESGSWDKKLGAKLVRDVQLQIDSAIDASVGNSMWSRGYMKPYSDRMAAARAHETRLDEAKEIAKQVKSLAKSSLTSGEVPQLPNVLSRPISVINYGLKRVLGDANTPVARELARRMSDPDEYAKLLQLPKDNPLRVLAGRVIAVSGGTAVEQEE